MTELTLTIRATIHLQYLGEQVRGGRGREQLPVRDKDIRRGNVSAGLRRRRRHSASQATGQRLMLADNKHPSPSELHLITLSLCHLCTM